ncbi:hypothetical protein Mal15_50340 [Stieleria maiorica]|uniref:Uncharacterized protein n=1 Tax=Stieleria maiorica TaxID=2795974 RepID=A0A5B9MPV2_9BACT|nr:hypothetical protein [Stieleria maiorica]QEG00958.1 hypothetical protein Mal15_50340 [Stieleria maiorica]
MQLNEFSRRRFAFWAGFALLPLADRIAANGLDDLAAVATSIAGSDGVDPLPSDVVSSRSAAERATAEHWSVVRNASWRWYERESLIDGNYWKTTGVTTPIHRETGKPHVGPTGYLDERLVPDVMLAPADRKRLGRPILTVDSWQDRQIAIKLGSRALAIEPQDAETMPVEFGDRSQADAGRSSGERRSRHGRPPSDWLLSLNADEIRIWLAKVEIQEAMVSGMTFWTHLTRDHSFDPDKIGGLTEAELAELHGAAHEGF